MLSLFASFADGYFQQQGDTLVFFPYGLAWSGYAVTPSERDRIRPYVVAHVVLKAVLLAVSIAVQLLRDVESSMKVVAIPIALLVASYWLDICVVTKKLPKMPADLVTSQDATVQIARRAPIWMTYIFFGLGCLMLSTSVLGCAIAIFLHHPLLPIASGAVFFGLCFWTALNNLRIARRLRPTALPAT